EFGGLIASGFFTVSLFMRAYVDGLLSRAAPAASPGPEELRWLAPERAGHALAARGGVVASARSRARPDSGTVTLRANLNRTGHGGAAEPVLRVQFRGWFRRRAPVAP